MAGFEVIMNGRFWVITEAEYLTHQINTAHKTAIRVEIATPQKEKSLQVVDFVSWALFRKYEKGDEGYYNIIKSKVVEEAPLFP
jgi:hypothetical protein